ncbi:hypothetical protein MTX26_27160 [Bradyrhizobium sp. ISRA443]|uniref:hypothetical protein n=1 Tax=unclassified Bradyrhizobium TaxID=2631580 RepID=UPI00247A452E|nr:MULTISPECIES: hypothetical protein [unclassified Bradyrhizobium]WGR93434.1 hypothetical protein MTX20_01975 [Bradyrhizobium sp. ISRA435]WGR97978.1 hypothetical protein MTX23_27155 [Bradyrhizobium sp. ISRA436]WGS04868.1 hypothetical protein MTX18_27165 [Bradyrhizobium sp. ISRA437]WGS11749.1 hypothetical protein MTX26_27160 [Bradyrhizobium sp. ISRA443]
MTRPDSTELVHIKYSHMTWLRAFIHNGGEFFACRLITSADDPRGPGPAISKTLQAGITMYDGCSIEQPPPVMHDETFVVLGGMVRILTGDNYSRSIEARPGDVLWLPKGAFWRFEGEKGSIFYVAYPGDPRMRTPAAPTDGPSPEVLHLRSQEMVFSQIHLRSGGLASSCRLITPEISKTLSVDIHTYDDCSIETTAACDEAIVVLEGALRILTGDNYSRVIEAKFSDVILVPRGVQLKYQGDKAKVFHVAHPPLRHAQ